MVLKGLGLFGEFEQHLKRVRSIPLNELAGNSVDRLVISLVPHIEHYGTLLRCGAAPGRLAADVWRLSPERAPPTRR
jgi:hypothetical protein